MATLVFYVTVEWQAVPRERSFNSGDLDFDLAALVCNLLVDVGDLGGSGIA
jgi:hypothetical protein